MASESAQVLTEMILNGPEIVLIEHVLVTALERSGLSLDNADSIADNLSGPLAGVHARWGRHVHDLDSGGYGVSVDGIGLRVLSVPLSDIPVLFLALKGQLVDLLESGLQEDDSVDEEQAQLILEMIARLEKLL